MAKEKCSVCGMEVGWLSKWKLKDGIICNDCVEKLKKDIQKHTEEFTVEEIKQSMAGKLELSPPKIFQCVKGSLVINPVSRTMYMQYPMFVKSDEIPLDSIVGYSYVENEKKYGVGRTLGIAAVGGVLLGGVGAVIGAVIGSGSPKKTINKIAVEITYEKDKAAELLNADIYKGKPLKSSGFEYNSYLETAKLLMGELDLLIKQPADVVNAKQEAIIHASSSADEIRKFKELLDEGIITQEEFEAKKKELLNL